MPLEYRHVIPSEQKAQTVTSSFLASQETTLLVFSLALGRVLGWLSSCQLDTTPLMHSCLPFPLDVYCDL